MIRKLIVIIGNLGVLAAFVVGIFILGQMKPQPERGEPQSFDPVAFVETVDFAPVQLRVFAQGEVRPKQEIFLTPQVGGKIVSVSPDFAAGGLIREGETLVQIEDADFRLAVTRAQAQVAQAEQALKIERAESELAQQDYQELSGLSDQGAPSDLALRRPQLARVEAEYQAALANLRDAQLALSRTQVKAPFSGRVRQINANVGQFVSPGFQLGQVFSTDVAEIRLPLTDEDLARLDLPLAFTDDGTGPDVTLSTIAAGKMRTWTGRVKRVDAAIDASTRQISAIVEVKDPYGAGADDGFPLAIGLFVDAEISGPKLDRAITLPRIAVQNDNTVYTIDDENRIVSNTVTVATYTRDGAIITDGLSSGDRVVISRLNAPVGSKVRPLDPNDPSAADDTEEDDADAGGVTAAAGGDGANAGVQ
jgi:RND family efflux transporter MFP subunit